MHMRAFCVAKPCIVEKKKQQQKTDTQIVHSVTCEKFVTGKHC